MIPSLPAPDADRIATIIHNLPLATAIQKSVMAGLGRSFAHLPGGQNAWEVFDQSLRAAITDIENHPRGVLFRRLIEYGPQSPDAGGSQTGGETTLSDAECGTCVEFVFSHMVNRFKGELAELLALAPCITLVEQLRTQDRLPNDIQLYWGGLVQERRRLRAGSGNRRPAWGGFTKGADGLLAQEILDRPKSAPRRLRIYGIVEVKSMTRSSNKILGQIARHLSRLKGGVKLGTEEWEPGDLVINPQSRRGLHTLPVRVMVTPSHWKLSRAWRSVKSESGRMIVLPEPADPPVTTQIEKLEPGVWHISLAWSQEALEQAAYEMTFWYMSQVGQHIYSNQPLPKGWEGMSPEEAGYNAIKMMLYYILLRCDTARHEALATKLYNVYSFGYPLGIDSKEMLWPQDFPDTESS